jgi:hypothetical protein
MEKCMEECDDCQRVCAETMQYCLTKGGRHVAPEHVRLMTDCIEICQTASNFMLRGSELHTATCRACAEVCNRCADDCASFNGDDVMARCADACRECAESCERMASA